MPLLDKLLRKLGVRINRFQASPYEALVDAPRYRETTVDLLGQPFKVADARSFYHSFREIFYDKVYEFKSVNTQPLIIDCGSNFGTSVVFFKSIYPDSRIVAVESDPKIFKLLEWNLARRSYKDIILMNRAVSTENKVIRFFCEGADGGRVFPIEGCTDVVNVETVNLDDLIETHVDLLKIDIEGAETEVVCSAKKLRSVDRIFVEYHSFKDTPQSLAVLLEKLSSEGFRYYIHKQFCAARPFTEEKLRVGQDLQLNIFAKRNT